MIALIFDLVTIYFASRNIRENRTLLIAAVYLGVLGAIVASLADPMFAAPTNDVASSYRHYLLNLVVSPAIALVIAVVLRSIPGRATRPANLVAE